MTPVTDTSTRAAVRSAALERFTRLIAGADSATRTLAAWCGEPPTTRIHTREEAATLPKEAVLLGLPPTTTVQRSKAKGAFLRSALDGSQIRTIFERLTSDDYGWPGVAAVFVTWGGKINALSPQDTAVAERESVAVFSVGNFWDNPEEDEKHVTWTRTLYRDVFAATGGVPVPNDRTGGCYINWPDPDLLEEEWNQSGVPWSELYYGGNYKNSRKRRADGIPTRSSTMSCRSSRAEYRAGPAQPTQSDSYPDPE